MSRKLYRVTCKGMTYSSSGGTVFGVAYVVAKNTDAAYEQVRQALDSRALGFKSERELDRVELLAEEADYPDCNTILYIDEQETT